MDIAAPNPSRPTCADSGRRYVVAEFLEAERADEYHDQPLHDHRRRLTVDHGGEHAREPDLELRGADRESVAAAREERSEERLQGHERDGIEDAAEECRAEPHGERSPERPEQPEEASPHARTAQVRLGNSNATGRITSSGETPPWRKAPR